MIKIFYCVIIVLCFNNFSFAQNNAIFKGGNADGWNSLNYNQIGGNIFKGGVADGWNSLSYIQNGGNIFRGGIGDGWASRNYVQQSNNIFTGGIGDGWASRNYIQQSKNIFTGGIGDGWDTKNYIQSSFNIFLGGIGDGWASTYRPQGPLPVTFLSFTATRQQSGVLVNWKTSQEINSDYFEVERSIDAVNFISIGRVKAAGFSNVALDYRFTDAQPEKGLNYYRLKQVDLDNRLVYTPARLVRFDGVETGSVKYFPNPTQGLLNIELTGDMVKEAKVINISNAAGIVVDQIKIGNNNNSIITLDMIRHPKGVYFIQIKSGTINSTQRIILL